MHSTGGEEAGLCSCNGMHKHPMAKVPYLEVALLICCMSGTVCGVHMAIFDITRTSMAWL